MVLDSSASARREAETAAVAQDCLPLRLRALLAFRPVEPLRRTSRRGPLFLTGAPSSSAPFPDVQGPATLAKPRRGPAGFPVPTAPTPGLGAGNADAAFRVTGDCLPHAEQAPPIESPLRAGARNSPADRRRADGAHGPGGRASAQSGGTCRRRSAAPANSPAHTAGGCRSSS